MKEIYEEYILKNINKPIKNECYNECIKMQKLFPELNIKRGTYKDIKGNEMFHFWLYDEENKEIIDPTISQFLMGGVYFEMGDEIHRCVYCGKLYDWESYNNSVSVCSESCHINLFKELNI